MGSEEPRRSSYPQAKSQKAGGFKWKDKKSADSDRDRRAEDGGALNRGYRNRSPRRDAHRDSPRDRSPRNDRWEGRDRGGYRERSPRRERTRESGGRSGDNYRPGSDLRKSDDALVRSSPQTREPASTPKTEKPVSEKKDKAPKPKKAHVSTEPMIVVNINDRLGTKAAIPCLASDSVKAFKAIVAAHIGRQPHEIMIKRQGERPFKDQLTLDDYGVSSGVQLDLEIDTGD